MADKSIYRKARYVTGPIIIKRISLARQYRLYNFWRFFFERYVMLRVRICFLPLRGQSPVELLSKILKVLKLSNVATDQCVFAALEDVASLKNSLSSRSERGLINGNTSSRAHNVAPPT